MEKTNKNYAKRKKSNHHANAEKFLNDDIAHIEKSVSRKDVKKLRQSKKQNKDGVIS